MSIQPNEKSIDALVPAPEAVSSLLLRLIDGWSPTAIELAPAVSARFGGIECSEMAPQLAIASDCLVVTVPRVMAQPRLFELAPLGKIREVDGTLPTGSVFRGTNILRVSVGADLKFESGDWFVGPEDDSPSLWVGTVEGALDVDYGGNLIVEHVRKDGLRIGHTCHFRVCGAHTYYLVQRPEGKTTRWHLAMEAKSGLPERDALERDFRLLQFVLGCQLRVPVLVRVDRDGKTVSAMSGVGTRSNLAMRSAPPVPINRDNEDRVEESWAALLFDQASAKLSAEPNLQTAFWIATDAYLDAMGQHLDADYLRLQVGLEAFAYWLLRTANGGERAIVKDKSDWKAWVKNHSGEIRALAAEGFEESLVQKVMGVYRLSSGKVVPSAFLDLGLALTEELKQEIEGRDEVVHQGLMAPDGYDGDRDLRRLGMIRTLLVALVSKRVGYSGAINGWDVGTLGHPLQPTGWWTVSNEAQQLARRTYTADDGANASTAG